MRARIEKLIEQLRSSYWFIPAVMAISALILSYVAVTIDHWTGSEWLSNSVLVSASRPDGARSVLTAIGGSMIGVAGTVFSVTMAAVVYASGQYGPRLLTNFLSDRGNQITLGMFTATFVFSMMVLRTIQSPSDNDGFHTAGFVPNLALIICIVLALCSIAVLIYFIHHVPTRIHISNVIEEIGENLLSEIGRRFPATIGEGAMTMEEAEAIRWQLPPGFRPGADDNASTVDYGEVTSTKRGYIQFLDEKTLMRAARRHTVVVRINIRPGSFIFDGAVLFDVWPTERMSEDVADDLRSAIAAGARRTPANDWLFLIDELVEIAARALSPGVNDPFTAVTCMDWLAAAMADLSSRDMPDPLRADDDGRLCIVTEPLYFSTYLQKSFGAIREYAAGDKVASVHFLQALEAISRHCADEESIRQLILEAGRLLEISQSLLSGPSRKEVEKEAEILIRALRNPRHRRPFPDIPDIYARLPKSSAPEGVASAAQPSS